jgi:dTDP-4-dehydrorhamnose reductase
MDRILVTGADGQVGCEIRELESGYPQYTFYYTDYKRLNITDHRAVAEFISANKITAVINCAAYTEVDKAEKEPEAADKVNHQAVGFLAEIARERQLKLIHISTDYVFDGTSCSPYTETDVPNPQTVYGKSKLEGERALQKINPANAVIIRTSWVYSAFGSNFVKTMLSLAREREKLDVIFDQVGSPTYAGDLARVLLEILPGLNGRNGEIYHYANEGVCSWYDFAKALFDLRNIEVTLRPIVSEQYPTLAKRPGYSVLNKDKIKDAFGMAIPNWKDSLSTCLHHNAMWNA